MDPDLEALALMSSHLDSALGKVADDQLAWPTPCSDWDLSGLIDHVTGGNWFTVKVLEGQVADTALAEVMARFDGTTVSPQTSSASVQDQLVAFGRKGVLDGTWHHVAGDLTGRRILRLRLHDLIVHTWDIEQTLKPPATLPEALVRWGVEELSRPDSLAVEHFGVAPVVQAGGDVDTGTVYLSAFDRRP